MAEQVYYFTGKACWVKDKPNKWGKWDMTFYPDKTTRDAMKATGFKNKTKVNEEEKGTPENLWGQQFYTLRNDKQAYAILDAEGKAMTKLVGNGSEVTVKLSVELFNSPEHGPSARSRLEGVVVNNLVEYTRPVETTVEAKVDLPA